jgi:hypothetical protein
MPRYFFHVIDGRASMDAEGTELPGLEEARTQAIVTAGEILRQSATHLCSGAPWQMTVADAQGDTVFTLRFPADDHRRYSR